MNAFSVRWAGAATDELARLWMTAAPEERRRISEAADEIDRELRASPEDAGESRSDGKRILLNPPLAVIFDVSAADRVVAVARVTRFGKRRDNN